MGSLHVLDLRKPILVTMESFAQMKDAKVVSDDGSVFETTLINCNQVSRNRTYYPLEDVLASLQDRRVQEKIDQKVFWGEAEHPASENGEPIPLKRLLRVEPKRWSHRIDNYWVEGNDIKGVVQWGGPFGDFYRKGVIEHGSNFAMSIRAYTPNYVKKNDNNGQYVVKKHLMYIATFDCVIQPGLEGARIFNPSQYSEISKNDKVTVENTNRKNVKIKSTESLTEVEYTNPVNEIRDILRSEEGADVISDIFGVNFDSTQMTISGKNTLSVISEEGLKLELPLSRTILSDIL